MAKDARSRRVKRIKRIKVKVRKPETELKRINLQLKKTTAKRSEALARPGRSFTNVNVGSVTGRSNMGVPAPGTLRGVENERGLRREGTKVAKRIRARRRVTKK